MAKKGKWKWQTENILVEQVADGKAEWKSMKEIFEVGDVGGMESGWTEEEKIANEEEAEFRSNASLEEEEIKGNWNGSESRSYDWEEIEPEEAWMARVEEWNAGDIP